MRVDFVVYGLPATKGSVRSFLNRKTGKVVSLADNRRLKGWEAAVALSAQAAGARPVLDAVSVALTFLLPRPKGHLRKDGTVRESAPFAPATKPDVDKLVRAVLDGLIGVGFRDDAQVVEVRARKLYAAGASGTTGVSVSLATVERESSLLWDETDEGEV